jgi:long-chain acyl-CoA synthetase
MYSKITTGIAAAGGMKSKLFNAALAAKTEGLKKGHLHHALYDRLIFSKIKKGLGMDHLRVMISGSAPLSENVMTFFRCMLGIPVVEGYGQTEGAASGTISHPDDISTVGHVGCPVGSVEIVLMNVPEMGYLHSDREHRGQKCYGRGEICLRGPSIFKGYYKAEDKTKEAIDEDGWLHSGDVGMWRQDGSLQIIDRKKNIFKLAQGEYVAPEKIENILGRSPLIAQCFVYGDSHQSQLVAIVVPDEEPVRHTVGRGVDEHLSASSSFAEICQSAKVKEAIMKDIVKLSKENGLQGFEAVKAIHLEASPFSVENDLMTPTFKLKRQKVRDRYEKEIETLYAGLVKPISKL